MLTAYRIVYGLVLVVFLGNILKTIDFRAAPAHQSVLLVAATVALRGLLALLLAFPRIRPATFWFLVLVWEGLFAWYAWFIPAAPFTLRELHTFGAVAASRETTVHYLWAGALFAVLFIWFFSLPARALETRRRAEGMMQTAYIYDDVRLNTATEQVKTQQAKIGVGVGLASGVAEKKITTPKQKQPD